MRADELLEAGDLDGCAMFKREVKATEELLSRERPPGAPPRHPSDERPVPRLPGQPRGAAYHKAMAETLARLNCPLDRIEHRGDQAPRVGR